MKEPGMKLMAGYVGKKDPNRNEARRLLKGDLTDRVMPKSTESMSSPGRQKLRFFKKGGHNTTCEEGKGTIKKKAMPKFQKDMVLPKREPTTKVKVQKFSEAEKMKKSHGGSVYEKEMVGMHPSKKPVHINYESQMRGEHGKKAKLSRGGCPPVKLAPGGPGKMRKGEMTKSGMPTIKSRCKGKV